LLHLTRSLGLELKIFQMQPLTLRRTTANGGLDQGDLLLRQQNIVLRTPVTPIGDDLFHPRARFQLGQHLAKQPAVVGGVRRYRYVGDQLQRVLGVTGLAQVDT